jgi:FtsH-binding integral membrane protein
MSFYMPVLVLPCLLLLPYILISARVYSIVSAQLVTTAAIVVYMGLHAPPGGGSWMTLRLGNRQFGASMPMLSLALSTIAMGIMVAYPPARRQQANLQWPLLALFTLGESLAVGCITTLYAFRSVVAAMGVTALSAMGISLYTIRQKDPRYDLSQWGAGLSS